MQPSHADRVPAGILFGDMKGSTASAERDEFETVGVIREYLRLIDATVRAFSPRFFKVKSESDGFMARFSNAHVMVQCGMTLRKALVEHGWKVRLGGSYVEAFEEAEGDLLGADMNRAARIASAADAETCQFLVSDAVPPVVRDRLDKVVFKEHGVVEAKGVDDGLRVFEVVAAGEPAQRDRQRAAYLAAVVRAHEWIDLGGLAPQVGSELLRIGLDDIFVHLSAHRKVPQLDHYYREEIRVRRELQERDATPAERERRLRALAERADQRYAKENGSAEQRVGLAALAESSRTVVLGDPGSGKTTLLRYVARRVALRWALDGDGPMSGPWSRLTPVYIRVGEFAAHFVRHGSDSLDDFIPSGAGPYAVPMPRDLLEFEKRHQRCLFLFDGLDEIVDTKVRQRVRDAIRKFVETCAGCPFIVSSRIVGYREAALPSDDQGFAHFTLRPFGDDEIGRFFERWYHAIARTGQISNPARQNARLLIDGIRANPGVQRLATNPLLLTLIALVYWREVKLPRRRIELYRSAADTLLDKWRQVGLDVRESTSILMAIAFEMHSTSGAGLITRPELERLVVDLKTDPRRGGRPQLDAERETAELLRLLSEQSGILYPRGHDERSFDVFGFLHLTFEEYFAARELARRFKQRTLRLADYVHLPRWREILLLASAHLSDDDDEVASDAYVRQILEADSPFESDLHRDLLLAAHCLADDAVVGADLRSDILSRLDGAFATTIMPLNTLIAEALSAMAGSRVAGDALHLVLAKLHHHHRWVRSAAARAIGGLGERAATPEILASVVALLGDAEWLVRAAAARAVAVLGERAATPEILTAVIALLRDADGEVRATAARALGALGEGAATPEVLTTVVALLRDAEAHVRSAAADAVGALGERARLPEVHDIMIALLRDANAEVQSAAARALRALGERARLPEVHDIMIALLRDADATVRAAAARTVGALGEGAATPEVLTTVVGLLRDANAEVRAAAARALRALGEPALTPEVLTAVVGLLRDTSSQVRSAAVGMVGALGERVATSEILTSALALLDDAKAYVRSAAAQAIGALGERAAAPEVLTALAARLRDADAEVRAAAADAVRALGERAATPEVLTAVVILLRDADAEVRAAAAGAVGTLGERVATREILTTVVALFRDADWSVRAAVAGAVRALGERAATPEVLTTVVALLRDGDTEVRTAVAGAVGALGERAATLDLLSLLSGILNESRHAGRSLEDAVYTAELALAVYYRPAPIRARRPRKPRS